MNDPFSFETDPFEVWDSQASGQHGRWLRRDGVIVVLLGNPSLPDQQELGELPGKQRRDYTPTSVIDARYTQAVKRHDQVLYTVHPITVKFDSNFDEFAGRVAYALRDKLYYRHDGGRNARGLVRATGDLQVIHRLYLTNTPRTPNGTPIELNAILGRRRDPQASMRWVMVIRFNDSKGWGFFDFDPDSPIVVDPAETQQKAMATALLHASLGCQSVPGLAGKRICEMVGIAERVQYPNNWNLWYYERLTVDDYVDWHTKNSRRRDMTRATEGKVPFDGDAGYPHGNWRIYPFREAAINAFKQQDFDNRNAAVLRMLVYAEDEMRRTFVDILKMFSIDAASVFGPLVEEFRKHLVDLQNTPDSLYSAFKKYPNL
jgi:hypothetical protein